MAPEDLDETFGLIETAEIYMKIAHLPRLNTITDEMVHQLEARFGIMGREGMALGQYIAGMGFSNVGLGIVHSMATA